MGFMNGRRPKRSRDTLPLPVENREAIRVRGDLGESEYEDGQKIETFAIITQKQMSECSKYIPECR